MCSHGNPETGKIDGNFPENILEFALKWTSEDQSGAKIEFS